ncbi:coniferyl-aldehyde dehydrogenase [Pseudoalteromonas tunicata]|nr:coniferyl-aldehyde dehydrogenase [Pseudoalteromonas tunicata]
MKSMNNNKISDDLMVQFEQLKNATITMAPSSTAARVEQLKQLKAALLAHQNELLQALSTDYGQRSDFDSFMADLLPSIQHLNYTLKHLSKWMKPERRHTGLLLLPSKVVVEAFPLGVVGIIVPWNFPINLAFAPLITAIAAGNRVMLKLSEFTPHTNQVIRKICSPFIADLIEVVEGEREISEQFSSLPFDHLFFTGSTAVGRMVMAAAAKNLTPVTLELGGKSPVVITPDMPIKVAVERLIFGKCLNAGQICVAPDYVLLPKGKELAFIAQFRAAFKRMYKQGLADSDYSSIINHAQYQRLKNLLSQAEQTEAIISSIAEPAFDDELHRLAPHIIYNIDTNSALLNDEIFGPLLPIVFYNTIEEAISYINSKPHPLALYIMSFDKQLQHQIRTQTRSGAVIINDTVMHVAVDDAPFGGVGASGMGQYHGKEGFLTFSKSRTIFKSYAFNPRTWLIMNAKNMMMKVIKQLFVK